MKTKNYNVDLNIKEDWRLRYDPELVGEFLNYFNSSRGYEEWYDHFLDIKFTPGMFIQLPPKPTLEDFLIWCANRKKL